MNTDGIIDPVMGLLAKAMDAYSTRHKVISNNIANVDTPGYKRSYVEFERQLAGLVGEDGKSRDTEAVEALKPRVEVDRATASRYDGNNVNIDQEMSELAKNTISYNAAAALMKAKVSMMVHVISEGRR